jgi:hypothetical protein
VLVAAACELTLLLLHESALVLPLLDDPLTVDRSGMLGTRGTSSPAETFAVLVQIYGDGTVETGERLVIRSIVEVACVHCLDRHGDEGQSK